MTKALRVGTFGPDGSRGGMEGCGGPRRQPCSHCRWSRGARGDAVRPRILCASPRRGSWVKADASSLPVVEGFTAAISLVVAADAAPARGLQSSRNRGHPQEGSAPSTTAGCHNEDHEEDPMSHLELRARMSIRPGQLEGFKAQAAELMRLTRELDTQTLRYDWFLSPDS